MLHLKQKYLYITIKLLQQKKLQEKSWKDLNLKTYSVKTKVKKIGGNIKFNVITVSNSYAKQKKYYKNLDITEVTDNRKFWKSIKSHFGQGNSNSEKIMSL